MLLRSVGGRAGVSDLLTLLVSSSLVVVVIVLKASKSPEDSLIRWSNSLRQYHKSSIPNHSEEQDREGVAM